VSETSAAPVFNPRAAIGLCVHVPARYARKVEDGAAQDVESSFARRVRKPLPVLENARRAS
jgi:hypothetical protein